MSLRFLAFSIVCFLVARECSAWERFRFHHLNVLGTSLELQVECEELQEAQEAEAATLGEIDRLRKILSSYETDSELSTWQASGKEKLLSRDLIAVLAASEQWHRRTQGAFHPGIELVSRLWKNAEIKQTLPSDEQLLDATKRLAEIGWKRDLESGVATASSSIPLSFNAIAKGYIIDCAIENLRATKAIEGALIAIGGDIRCFGDIERVIEVSSPVDDLASPKLAVVTLRNSAIATSSGAFRGFTIAGKKYSHLIDPRNGKPVSHVRSVSVIAPNAMEADAAATACSVLHPAESLALIDSIEGFSCLILDADGVLHRSKDWSSHESSATSHLISHRMVAEDWNGGMELTLDFSINQAGGGGRYRRPYVAAWIEDKDGFPVKTLLLWVQSTGPGPRWIPDLKRWYRGEKLRKLADGEDLVETISEATRKPGQYSITWNGEDDSKQLLPRGEYTLYLEAAREHGTYQLIRKKVTLGSEPFKEKLDENVEIKSATVEYRKKSDTK